MRSNVMKQGAQRAPQRSLLKASGLTDEQISQAPGRHCQLL
jgi:hypothetical protein